MKQMTGLMVAAALAACGALVHAQDLALPALTAQAAPAGAASQSATAAPDATASCAYNFSVAGPLNSFLKYCVTVNGNIVSFNSPSGNDQLIQGTPGEGYGICDFNTGARYFDYAGFGDSGNWNPPVLVALSGASVKIARTTSDGAWTLTQTITKTSGKSPNATVSMALKNNSSIQKEFYLFRYADVDPADANATGNFGESFDSTVYSAWGYEALNSGRPAIGLKLTILGQPSPSSVPFNFEALDQNISSGPTDPCNPGANYAGLTTGTDGSVVALWVAILNPHQIGTFNSKYEMF